MKPALFAVMALFLYATQNVIIERKLAHISPIVNMVFFYVGTLGLALAILLLRKPIGLDFTMPQGSQYLLIAVCGVLLFFADFCFFSAYKSGGSLITVTTIIVLFPVFASLIKFASGGGAPSITQLIGWAMAAVAVVLVGK